MSAPSTPLHPHDRPTVPQRKSVVIYGEEDGHAYITIKTEVTIEVRDPAEVETVLDLARQTEEAFPMWRALSGDLPPAPRRPEDEG